MQTTSLHVSANQGKEKPPMAYKIFNSYRFMEHKKDPIIAIIANIMREEGLNIDQVAEMSNVHRSTLTGWFYGNTRTPMNYTVQAVLRSMGYEQTWTKTREVKAPMVGNVPETEHNVVKMYDARLAV